MELLLEVLGLALLIDYIILCISFSEELVLIFQGFGVTQPSEASAGFLSLF